MFADETRPFLQGARLTAWELVRDGIETTVITDNMAGSLMRQGGVNFVVVGADRIAANGDTANKIGTYSVAVLAREHDIPFYVAAPLSTIDLNTPDGSRIPIEERNAKEVTHVAGTQLAAVRRAGLESRVRRHAAPLHQRHHHRAGDLPRAVHRVAARGLRTTPGPKDPAVHSVVAWSFGPRTLERRCMLILGIETSCDETSAAVVEETGDAERPVGASART